MKRIRFIGDVGEEVKDVLNLFRDFYGFMRDRLEFDEELLELVFVGDEENAEKVLCRTAHYDPSQKSIVLYCGGS